MDRSHIQRNEERLLCLFCKHRKKSERSSSQSSFALRTPANMSTQKNSVLKSNNLNVVVLEGSPYNRGLTHGRTLKREINEVLGKWRAHLEADYGLKADVFTATFFEQTDFLPAIKRWTPELLEEVRGVADGAGIDFDTMLLFQLLDEEWLNAQAVTGEHCSSVGVAKQGDHPAMIAQNMDISGFYHGYQTLLHIKYPDSDLETLVFTCAGLVALNGVNNRSVGVAVNTLAQLAHSTDGLPVAFVIRGLLEQTSQEGAVKFLHTVKHASGQNYIIGGKARVDDFEASANRVSRYVPAEGRGVVYHTNHPLANDDYTDAFREWLTTHRVDDIAHSSSGARFQQLAARLGGDAGLLEVSALESSLAGDSGPFPVCVAHQNEGEVFTFGSTIMILADKPELRLTAGPPNCAEYLTFSFADAPPAAP